ncbi:hypothetical protein YC2023_052658 [Brassica napus]
MKISSDGKQVNVAREGERNKVVDLECSRFSLRRPVPSNRRFFTILTQKLCPIQSVQASHILLQSSGGAVQDYFSSTRSSTRCSPGKSEELRFCPSPDQPVEACRFLHGEAEVISKSRSVQSSLVKSSIGFWPSLLRSTSCLSAKNTVSYDQLIAELFSCRFPLLGS